MPNWCQNRVHISSDNDTLDAIRKLLRVEHYMMTLQWEDLTEYQQKHSYDNNPEKFYAEKRKYDTYAPISLNNVIPMPQEIADGEDSPWLGWRIENWGAKWDISHDAELEIKDGSLIYMFESAWSPPIAVFVVLADMYPRANIIYTYGDYGMDFCGIYKFENGEIVGYASDSYSSRPEYIESFWENS